MARFMHSPNRRFIFSYLLSPSESHPCMEVELYGDIRKPVTVDSMAQDVVTDFLQQLSAGNPAAIGIVVAIIIGVITLCLIFFTGKSNKRRGILLVGLCDSGKSLMFSRLVLNKFSHTQTSMKENVGSYPLEGNKKGSLKILDIPGYERVRSQFFDQYKGNARGIVFVVDSMTLQKELKDVAEYLYSVLTDDVISYNMPPILVACNKQDQTLAKGSKVIQTQLEKELNTLRVTKSATLIGTDNTKANIKFLGKKGKDFSFSDVQNVEFVECSAKGSKGESGEMELNQVLNWLEKMA